MYIKIATALNSQKKAVNGSKILFLGVAYKPDIDDERESPALEIMDITAHKGGVVGYHDPYIPAILTHKGISYQSVALTPESLNDADCVVLTTNHKVFEMGLIKGNARLIVDLRNMVGERNNNVFKL
jgi:UDP-N-acetyl-D-glucosamine dehydrogenase